MNRLRQGHAVPLILPKDAGTPSLGEEVDSNKHGYHQDQDHHQDGHADPNKFLSLVVGLEVLAAAIHVLHFAFSNLNAL